MYKFYENCKHTLDHSCYTYTSEYVENDSNKVHKLSWQNILIIALGLKGRLIYLVNTQMLKSCREGGRNATSRQDLWLKYGCVGVSKFLL